MNKGPCHPAMVYIDGQRMVDPWSTFTLPAEMVERVVLFRPVDAGALFTGDGSAAGVIMIFTREGSRR